MPVPLLVVILESCFEAWILYYVVFYRLGRFWLRDNQLKVQEVIDHQNLKNGVQLTEKEMVEQAATQYALQELTKYGFHTTRCKEALEDCNGDVGMAIQKLMFDCFIINNQDSPQTNFKNYFDTL